MKDLGAFVPAAALYLFRKMALNGRVITKEPMANGTTLGAVECVVGTPWRNVGHSCYRRRGCVAKKARRTIMKLDKVHR